MRNTSLTGEVCRTQIIAALTLQDKSVLLPLGDFQRYDLVVEDGGRFFRIQCKMGKLRNGAIHFHPCSIDSRSKKGGWNSTGLDNLSVMTCKRCGFHHLKNWPRKERSRVWIDGPRSCPSYSL